MDQMKKNHAQLIKRNRTRINVEQCKYWHRDNAVSGLYFMHILSIFLMESHTKNEQENAKHVFDSTCNTKEAHKTFIFH